MTIAAGYLALSTPTAPPFALSAAHLLNDLIASMTRPMQPLFKEAYKPGLHADRVDHAGFPRDVIAVLQPGSATPPITSRGPMRWSVGMTLYPDRGRRAGFREQLGYGARLGCAGRGLGRPRFHPEATRMARHAAAGHQAIAQGIFQIGMPADLEYALRKAR